MKLITKVICVTGVILVIALIVISWRCGRGSIKPPAVATVAETTYIDTGRVVINYRTDPASSKELEKLRDELSGKQGFIDQLTTDVAQLKQEKAYYVDSLSRIMLDSLRGIIRIERGPNGVAVRTYQRGLVQNFSYPVWHNRWTILAGKEKPSREQSAFPVDFGLDLGAELTSLPDTWTPNVSIWVGVMLKRQGVTMSIGPMYDGALKLRGVVQYEWW